MAKPPKTPSEPRSVKFIPVTVAVIGALALLLSAAVSNWDKISATLHPPSPATAPPAARTVSTTGPQSPVISEVGRDLTININRLDANQPLTGIQRAKLDGEWETDVFTNGGNAHRLFFRFKTLGDGRITGMVQYVDANDGRRFGPEFGIAEGKTDGRSFSVSFRGGARSQPDWKPVQEVLFGEVEGDVMQAQYQFSDMAPVDTTVRRVSSAPPIYGR